MSGVRCPCQSALKFRASVFVAVLWCLSVLDLPCRRLGHRRHGPHRVSSGLNLPYVGVSRNISEWKDERKILSTAHELQYVTKRLAEDVHAREARSVNSNETTLKALKRREPSLPSLSDVEQELERLRQLGQPREPKEPEWRQFGRPIDEKLAECRENENRSADDLAPRRKGREHKSAEVVTVAGREISGHRDGLGIEHAQFNAPMGLTFDREGRLLVADTGNNRIRRISLALSGLEHVYVCTMAGTGPYTTFTNEGFSERDAPLRDGRAGEATFNWPNDICVDIDGSIYVTDCHNHAIRRISPHGWVTTIAGGTTEGDMDGIGTFSRFSYPSGIDVVRGDSSGISEGMTGSKLFVADTLNGRIRSIDLGTREVNTEEKLSYQPHSIATGCSSGQDAVIAVGSHMDPYKVDIRRLRSGIWTSVTGPPPPTKPRSLPQSLGMDSDLDEEGMEEDVHGFFAPYALDVNPENGTVFVADTRNNRIVVLSHSGYKQGIILAGVGGLCASLDGPGSLARFAYPQGIAVSPDGQSVFVSDTVLNKIRRITTTDAALHDCRRHQKPTARAIS